MVESDNKEPALLPEDHLEINETPATQTIDILATVEPHEQLNTVSLTPEINTPVIVAEEVQPASTDITEVPETIDSPQQDSQPTISDAPISQEETNTQQMSSFNIVYMTEAELKTQQIEETSEVATDFLDDLNCKKNYTL